MRRLALAMGWGIAGATIFWGAYNIQGNSPYSAFYAGAIVLPLLLLSAFSSHFRKWSGVIVRALFRIATFAYLSFLSWTREVVVNVANWTAQNWKRGKTEISRVLFVLSLMCLPISLLDISGLPPGADLYDILTLLDPVGLLGLVLVICGLATLAYTWYSYISCTPLADAFIFLPLFGGVVGLFFPHIPYWDNYKPLCALIGYPILPTTYLVIALLFGTVRMRENRNILNVLALYLLTLLPLTLMVPQIVRQLMASPTVYTLFVQTSGVGEIMNFATDVRTNIAAFVTATLMISVHQLFYRPTYTPRSLLLAAGLLMLAAVSLLPVASQNYLGDCFLCAFSPTRIFVCALCFGATLVFSAFVVGNREKRGKAPQHMPVAESVRKCV